MTYFVLSWIIISGFIFSISKSTGMVDPENNPIDYIHLAMVFILSILFAIGSLYKVKKHIKVLLFIVVLSSLITSVINIYQSNIFHSLKKSDVYQILSSKKNILVISFDGMPGDITSNIIKNNIKMKNKMKDFTIFENAVSQAPATTASLIGDIYGIQDYKSLGNDLKSVQKTLKANGFDDYISIKYVQDSYGYGNYGYGGIKKIFPSSKNISYDNKVENF